MLTFVGCDNEPTLCFTYMFVIHSLWACRILFSILFKIKIFDTFYFYIIKYKTIIVEIINNCYFAVQYFTFYF